MPEDRKKIIISVSEAKSILDSLDTESADQIQKRAIDYSAKFSKIKAEEAKALKTKLMKECRLTDEEATEICNIMPRSVEEFRVFTAGWKKLIPTETVEKTLGIVGEYA